MGEKKRQVMRVKDIRRKYNRVFNVFGRKISHSYEYFIVLKPWFKRRRYVKLLPGWFEALNNDEPCKVELERHSCNATVFRDTKMCYRNKAMADTVAALMKSNQDKFILS